MKLLFDENLSFWLCRMLTDLFPETEHVVQAALDHADDASVWRFAAREGYVIVTLDSDFAELAAFRGPPPKVLWLRCGNQPTEYVADLLRNHADDIASFASDPVAACLELY